MNGFLTATGVIVITVCLMTLGLVYLTLLRSGKGQRLSLTVTAVIAAWGAAMLALCLQPPEASPIPGGTLGVSIFLALNLWVPTLLAVIFRREIVGTGLSMRWLLAPHMLRFVGILFIVEAFRGQLGTEFALAAGIGDVIAASLAVTLLLSAFPDSTLRRRGYLALVYFGVLDFVIAFALGALSANTPIQLFAVGEVHRVVEFPVGMIPFFLVPIAMAYHWLMVMNLNVRRETPAQPALATA